MLADILTRYKAGLSLAFTVLFSLSGLIWQSNLLSRTANQAVEVLDFFTATFNSLGNGFSNFVDSYRSYSALKSERDLLREKLKDSQDIHIRYLRLMDENNRLRQLMALPQTAELPIEQAEVISQDPDNWFRTIIISKGSLHGIEPYMPVLAYQVVRTTDKEGKEHESMVQGVIGKVIQVNRRSSRILPILDLNSRLGVQVKKTGHWALLVGQSPNSENPQLEYLSLGVFLNPGDEIITSGGDGIFPKGLPVGIVGNRIERLGSYQRADVIPVIDFKRLDFVMVVKKPLSADLLKFPPLSPENIVDPPLPTSTAKETVSITPQLEKTTTVANPAPKESTP